MNTSDYMNLVRKKLNTQNVNQTAKALGWTATKVKNYVENKNRMNNEACLVIANILEVPVIEVIATMEVLRTDDNEKKLMWLQACGSNLKG